MTSASRVGCMAVSPQWPAPDGPAVPAPLPASNNQLELVAHANIGRELIHARVRIAPSCGTLSGTER